jgi:hypothetical protein
VKFEGTWQLNMLACAGCGVCGGSGIGLDAKGVCCPKDGVINGGYCCQSGNVDDAGVCDGTGNTVAKVVGMSGVKPARAALRRRLLEDDKWKLLEKQISEIATNRLGYPVDLFTVKVQPNADDTDATVRCKRTHAC